MKIYTAAEMREHEQMAVDKGTTFEQLMENAGQAAAADLLRRFPKAGCALIVAARATTAATVWLSRACCRSGIGR